jgi:type IV pilus assembly protein PilE
MLLKHAPADGNRTALAGIGGRRASVGFTLIELMVVVAIVAVLAAVAFPSYTSHLRKGHRASAQAYLMDLAQREQQFFTDNRSFALDGGGVTAATKLNASAPPSDVVGNYSISTVARSVTPSFVITATALGSQTTDGNLSIDDTGSKTPTGKW